MEKSEKRCDWCLSDPIYIKYHDEEWGKIIEDDKTLFEFLLLESAQAGLSWLTILKKRENYRVAFDNFDVEKIAKFSKKDVETLIENKGIVRNRLKIESAIINAQKFIEVQHEFQCFQKYLWSFLPNQKPISNNWEKLSEVPTQSSISNQISKDMKKRGFKFFGTTTCYAYMQAVGMVNDHLINCPRKSK